ncbi:MAG: efflux RND transporter periplasmic adaptor subunit [Acidobacteria bacterium]|nr:efflux RND transporter periplasmic adaptor subunit [Acidobacteriota bacterium]
MKKEAEPSGSHRMRRLWAYGFLLFAVGVAVWLLLESGKDAAPAPTSVQAGPGGGPESPIVRVQEVQAGNISQTREYIGRVEAVDSVDLVARVSGYLESIHFVEGRHVRAGDLMFTLEENRYRAEIASRTGAVSQIEASLVEAEQYLGRLKSASRESVPEKDIEAAQRNVDSFKAQLVSARAGLDLAEIDLGYTAVRAPMSGRVTKKNYSVGDFVGPNSGTIATIVQFDPIRVVCSMSEVDYLNLVGQRGTSPETAFRPTLRLPNGRAYSGTGSWDFADTHIDATTGSISLRSRYSNPGGLLIPGGYVTVVMSSLKGERLPLVPQSAVSENKEGSFVYVVGAGNVAELRPIRKRSALGTDWIVEEGLKAGETIIVEGVQKVRPGQSIRASGDGAGTTPVTGGR